MANELHISNLNPAHWRRVNPQRLSKYFSKPFEDYRYHETLQDFEEQLVYKQPVTIYDQQRFQFLCNFNSVNVRLYDCRGYVATVYTKKLQSSKYMPMFSIFETEVNWSLYPQNETYFLQIFLADVLYYVSEPFYLGDGKGTLIFNYSNPKFKKKFIFETGIVPEFRVEGHIGRYEGGSNDTLFTDYNQQNYLLNSTQYDAFELIIGNEFGVPDWVAKKMKWIWGCRNVYIDGIQYSIDGAEGFEYIGEEKLARRGIKMKIREGVNADGLNVAPELNPDINVTVVYNIRSDVFGPTPSEFADIITITG